MFELRPYRKNEVSNAMYYNPFHEMEEMERRFFRDPFAMFDSNELATFRYPSAAVCESTLSQPAFHISWNRTQFHATNFHTEPN